jgi:hypothetical protein
MRKVPFFLSLLLLTSGRPGLASDPVLRTAPLVRETGRAGRSVRALPASGALAGRERALAEGLRLHPEWRIRPSLARPSWTFSVGSTRGWYAYDFTTEKDYVVQSTCRAVGSHCYIFVENAIWGNQVTQAAVDSVRENFEVRTPADPSRGVFQTDVDVFGPVPDVDGDARIIILILNIVDGFETTGGYIGGYFDSTNEYDLSKSNRAEMIYLDADPVDLRTESGIRESMSIVAHEFQHMLHWNQDPDEIYFVKEGCSVEAEVICGYGIFDQEPYVNETNHALLDWRYGEDAVYGDYSRAARFMAYLGEQAGQGVFRPLVAGKKQGLLGLNAALTSIAYSRDFNAIFRDWLVANLLDDRSVDPKYGYAMTGLLKPVPILYSFPTVTDTQTVEPLGAVYLRFPVVPGFRVRFETAGASLVIKAVETGGGSKRVFDVTPGVEVAEPVLGSAATLRTFICMNTDPNLKAEVRYSASGASAPAVELKYDETEPTGYLQLTARDTVCVTFDAVPGARLDSVRVALRRAGTITGGVWKSTGLSRPTPLGDPLAYPVSATIATTTPVPYPVPFENWATIDLTSYAIDAGSPFAVGFIYAGTGSVGQRVMVAAQKRTGSDRSLTYMHEPGGTSVPNWYSVGPTSDSLYTYLIRAYVSQRSTDVVSRHPAPSVLALHPNYPNPFNPDTRIGFSLPRASRVSVEIWNALGERTAVLADRTFEAGAHSLTWNGTGADGLPAPSGVYVCRLTAGAMVVTRKMVLER